MYVAQIHEIRVTLAGTSMARIDASPFFSLAVLGCDKKVVKLLTDIDKTDLEIKDEEGKTAIEVAVDGQKMGEVKQLLRKDAKMNPSAMVSALHTAAKGGKVDLVESLLKENELDIGARYSEQNTALHLGVSSTDMVRLLLRKGADIDARNNRGEVALHLAVEQGNEDLLDVLLAYGANANARNQNLDTAPYIAIRANNEKLVKLLLCGGANVHARTKKFETTLHLAALERNLNMMADLLDCGAEISNELPNKAELLYLVAKTGNILVAKSLLNFTTKILQEKGGSSGHAAIEIAMIKKKHEMVEMLKKRGAKPSIANA